MGLNVGSLYLNSAIKPVIDTQALAKVSEQILNPNNKTVDVSQLDLSKFNRVSLGTDLYSARTSTETALKTAKAAVDFDLNFSKAFSANVQYLNSQAAQSLFTSKENNGKAVISTDNLNQSEETKNIVTASQVAETKDMQRDKKGSNPFSFYVKTQGENPTEDNESINIFA